MKSSRLKPGQMKITDALMHSENGLSFTELKAKTTLSAPVLSEYLKKFVAEGFIDRNVARKYKLKTIYLPWEKLTARERWMRFLASSSPLIAMKINSVKDDVKRAELIEEFMKMYLMYGGSVMVFNIINHALDEWDAKANKNLDLLLPILKEQIGNWIVPYVQKLALAIGFFDIKDLQKTLPIIDEIAQHWLVQLNKTRDILKEAKIIE